MDCRHAEPLLPLFLDGPAGLDGSSFVAVEAHAASCQDCTVRLRELRLIQDQVRSLPRVALPEDFRQKFHLALAAEPVPVRPLPLRLLDAINWPSLALGAAAAASLALFLWRSPVPGVTIEAAAVPIGRDVAVQVAFEVQEDVEDVTFDVRLPSGLRFVDAKGRPVDAPDVSWKGELRKGRTVVPIAVRAIQPGRWEIVAVVRKDSRIRETRIVLPVRDGSISRRKGADKGGEA